MTIETATTHSPEQVRRVSLRVSPLLLAYTAYIVFGLCLIFNCQVDSDGTWYLYGHLLQHGVRLYTDLKLPQQPLFILMTAWEQVVLGDSWLLSLIPTVFNLVLFTHGFYLLAKRSNWPEWQQAIVFLGSAFVAIAWNSYRFDDYRILTDTIAVYTVLALLRLIETPADERGTAVGCLALGVLSGLSFTTRANDGLLLLIAVAAILFQTFPKNRVRNLVLLAGAFLTTSLAVVLMTGDDIGAYFHYTLLGSPDSKGGVQQVLLSPLMLAGDLLTFTVRPLVLAFEVIFLLSAAIPVLVARRIPVDGQSKPLLAATTILGVALFECLVVGQFSRLSFDCIANIVSPLFMLALGIVSVWVGLSVLGLFRIDNRTACLFLVPFGAVIAGGMSSGGKHLGIHGPIGLFMAIIPVVFTLQDALKWGRAYVLTIYSLLALAIAVGKVQRPLMWEYYQAQPMFIDRAVISHPLYGPMVVDRTINRFFSGVCQTIRTSNTNRELLSLPYSYANYYCGITPWHQNVQTFIDTSNILTIRKIQNGLSTQPPGWILYQRQLQILSLMEFFFNHGRRVPQRDLDDLIEGKIARGTWKVVSHWQEQPGDDWLLIQTTPGRS